MHLDLILMKILDSDVVHNGMRLLGNLEGRQCILHVGGT